MDPHYVYIGMFIVFHRFHALFIFLCSFLFLFLSLSYLNWPIFKFTDLFFCQLMPVLEFLLNLKKISIVFLLNCRIFTWFIFVIFISLLIFSIWYNIVFIYSFNSLDMVSFHSLNIFIILDLHHFEKLNPTYVLLFMGSFYRVFFFFSLCISHIFLFLCMTYNFAYCWKLEI